MVFFLTFLVHQIFSVSKIQFRPEESFESQDGSPVGFFDLQYSYNDVEIPFSKNNNGTEVKLIVNSQTFYPSKMNKGPYNDLIVIPHLDKLTEDDVFVNFIVRNTGEEQRTFSLGTFTHINFLNTINSANKFTRNDRSFYFYTTKDPTWRKLAFDHNSQTSMRYTVARNYIQPNNSWYGHIKTDDDKYFMKFNSDSDMKLVEANSDGVQTSYSWENIKLDPSEQVILGTHITFLMKSKFQIIPQFQTYAFETEKAGNVECLVYIKGLTIDKNYSAMYRLVGTEKWSKDQNYTFKAIKSNERWGYRSLKPQGPGEFKYEIKLSEQGGDDSNIETITFTISKKPTLSLQSRADISKKYNDTETIPLTLEISGDTNTTVRFMLFSGSYQIRVTEEVVQLDTENSVQTKTFNYPLTDLRSGNYTLKIVCLNRFGLSSEERTTEFQMEYQTYISSTSFDKTVYYPGEIITAKGIVQETDEQQVITFHVKLSDSESDLNTTTYTPTGKRDDFSVICTAPSTLGLYSFYIYATYSDNIPFYNETFQLRITEKPSLSYTHTPQGDVFMYNQTVTFALNISDDSKGTVHYMIDSQDFSENYTTTDEIYNLNINLQEKSVVYSNQNHMLTIYVQDEYGLTSNTINFPFKILTPSDLKSIEVPTRIEPNNDTNIAVSFDDFDNTKKLYFYAQISDDIIHKLHETESKGTAGQSFNCNINLPSGNYNVKFFLSTRSDSAAEVSTNSESNQIPKQIISTKVPDLHIKWPEIMKFGSVEKIDIELTAIDENSGKIHYYIDDNEQYLNDDSILKIYTNITANQPISLPIPDTIKFGNHKLKIQLTDDFGEDSEPKEKEFNIINKPLINNVRIEPKNIIYNYSSTERVTAKVIADCYNIDENRDLGLYWIFGENGDITKIIDSDHKSGNFTLEKDVEITQRSGKNIPIMFYLYDGTERISKNAISDGFPETVNITAIPRISSTCPLMNTYGINDTVDLTMEIHDDTNGRIKFFLGESDLEQDYLYNTTNGILPVNVSINLPSSLTRGKYNISYYSIDEFGYKSNEIECEILFKNKPILSGLKLSKDSADNDEEIFVSGNLTDYDVNKIIYIYQKIGNEQPKVIGNLTSEGGSTQTFNLKLLDLVYLKSGNTSVDIIACDNERTISDLDPHATSLPYHLYIDMVNDPEILVEFPADEFYSLGETFNITINVTADLEGQIKIYEVVEGVRSTEPTEIATIPYNSSGIYQYLYTCRNEVKDYQIAVQADGPRMSKSVMRTKDISCRNAPKLNEVILSRHIIGKSGSFSIDYKFDKSAYNNANNIYLFAKFNGKIIHKEMSLNHPVLSLQINVDLSTGWGKHDVLCWYQFTREIVKLSKSNEINATVVVTKTPEVTFNFDSETYFGYTDKYSGYVLINDDSEGSVVVELKNGELTKNVFTGNYSSNNIEKHVNFSFLIDKEFKYGPATYVNITVADEYGMSVSQQKEIKIINKPKIKLFNITHDYALEGNYINADVIFTDFDKDKPIYFYYILNDKTTKAEQTATSNGQENETTTIQIFVPIGTQPKQYNVLLDLTNLESQDYESKDSYRNSYATSKSSGLYITYKPTISANSISKVYSKGQQILVKGQISGDNSVSVVMQIDDKQPVNYTLSGLSNDQTDYEYNLTLPDDIQYGTRTLKVKAVDSRNIESATTVTKQFTYKNKPKIARVDNIKDHYDPSDSITFDVYVDDSDNNKELYIHGQIGTEDPFILHSNGQKSTGENNQKFEINQLLVTSLSGAQTIKVWASDSFDSTHKNDIYNSEKFDVNIVLKYTPQFDVTFSPDTYQIGMNSSIEIKYTHNEEGNVTLKIFIDNKEISEEISSKSGIKSVKITDEIGYNQKLVSVYIINKFKFESSHQEKNYYVTSPPDLYECGFTKNFVTPGNLIEIEGKFNDLRKDQYLFIFLKLGDREVQAPSHKIQSDGNYNQKFRFGITIPKDEIIGDKSVTFWMSSKSDPSSSNPLHDSKNITGNLLVTFKPSLEIDPLSKTIYETGDTIEISGTVNAHFGAVLKYKIDSVILDKESQVAIENYHGKFNEKIEIPRGYRYGGHTLYVMAVDTNDQSTSYKDLKFRILNPPKVLSIELEKDEVNVGQNLIVKGTIQDKDFGNDIRIIYRLDKGEQVNAHKLKSDGSVQDFTFSILINLEVGKHTIDIIAKDNDDFESSVSRNFTVVKAGNDATPNNQKSNESSQGKNNLPMILGVVIATLILIALLVVAAILYLKKKQSPQNNNSASEPSDVQENETYIGRNNSTIDEIATHDNPLFSNTPIGNETDPFSDEFEESQIYI